MGEPEGDRIGARRLRGLVHQALDREHVHVCAEAAQGRDPERHRGDEIVRHPGPGEAVERDGVAVAAALGLRQRLRRRGRERTLQHPGREQLAGTRRAGEVGRAAHRVVPVGDAPVRPQHGGDLGHHRAAIGLPQVLLLAGVLHPHRPAKQGVGQQRRVARRIVGAVMAVAARALDVDAAHLDFGQRQHLGQRLAQGEHPLRMRPDGEARAVELRHRAGRADRAVHLVASAVLRGDRAPRRHRRSGAGLVDDRALRLPPGEVGKQRIGLRHGGAALPDRVRGERPHRRDGGIFPLGHHRQKVPVAVDPDHPGPGCHGLGLEGDEAGARAGRAYDPGMHHPRRADVLNVGRPARDLGGDVDPRQRPADEGAGAGFTQGRRLGHRCVEVDFGGEFRKVQPAPVRRRDRAVGHAQRFRPCTEPERGRLDEQRPRGGGGEPDRGGGILHRVAAGGVALVGGQLGVGGDQAQDRRIEAELLRGDLDQRRLDPLAEFGLAGEHRDAAVRIEADPGIDPRRLGEAAGQRRPGRADPDEERAADEQRPAGERGHDPPPAAGLGRPAARRTAARIRMCVPQRQRLSRRAARISSSPGCGFSRSRAWARITMPAMQ
jgi:hypothetical protein